FVWQIQGRRIGLTQVKTLPSASGIDDKNLQLFPPFQNEKKLVIQLQRIVDVDADLAFRKAERQIESRKLRQRRSIRGYADNLLRSFLAVETYRDRNINGLVP